MDDLFARFAARLSDLGVTARVGSAVPAGPRHSDDDRASDTWHVNSGLPAAVRANGVAGRCRPGKWRRAADAGVHELHRTQVR